MAKKRKRKWESILFSRVDAVTETMIVVDKVNVPRQWLRYPDRYSVGDGPGEMQVRDGLIPTIMVTDQQWKKLQERGEARGMTANEMLVLALERYFAKFPEERRL